MRVITQDFVAAGKPGYILANAGVVYLDIIDGKRYRQITIPYGQAWVEIEKEQVFIPVTGGGTVTSVGFGVSASAPSAFSVSGSPIIKSGTIQLSFTGSASQYIKGDGSLGTTPTGISPLLLMGG